MGKRATEYVEGLVKAGKIVNIEYDVQKRDKYGRLLGYVFLRNGKMLNEEIVKAGYADVMTIPPNVKYEDRFLKAYQEARENNRGIVGRIRMKTMSYYLRLVIISPLFLFLFIVLACAVSTPYFETNLMVNEYQLTHSALARICHQFPTRCFYVFDSNMGLCSRCFSVYSALFLSSICFIFIDTKISWKQRSAIALALTIPLIVDGVTQFYNLRVSNNYIRLITGIMAGLGISIFFISPYITSGTNLLTFITRRK